jgi:UDP-2,3-diacylglucosamine pyrophosphatase LpxH
MPKHRKTRRSQMVVVANDFHVPFHDAIALALFQRFLRREQPDWLILNGDLMDFWEVSRFDLTPRAGDSARRS